jgi:hypothetical protein
MDTGHAAYRTQCSGETCRFGRGYIGMMAIPFMPVWELTE